MNTNKRVEFLLHHNKEQSGFYSSVDEVLRREHYRARHPAEIAVLKCMDGRLNLAVMTNTPFGIVHPYRNLGGKFDLGAPYFGKHMINWVHYAMQQGRYALILITYHWSAGDPQRGCRGFNYDVTAARAYSTGLKEQFERVFGKRHQVVYPLVVGIETDSDSLVLHADQGNLSLDLNNAEKHLTKGELDRWLLNLYPDMHPSMRDDLIPLLLGNLSHVSDIRHMNRPIESGKHQEWCIAFGRGYDWLHLPNTALIVGPYSLNLEQPIATAASIVYDNILSGRINPDDGLVLMISGAYRIKSGPEYGVAIEKARAMRDLAFKVIQEHYPKVLELTAVLVGITDMNTRLFQPLK